MYKRICIYIHICIYAFVYIHVRICIYIYIHTCIYIYVYVYTCVYMYTHVCFGVSISVIKVTLRFGLKGKVLYK